MSTLCNTYVKWDIFPGKCVQVSSLCILCMSYIGSFESPLHSCVAAVEIGWHLTTPLMQQCQNDDCYFLWWKGSLTVQPPSWCKGPPLPLWDRRVGKNHLAEVPTAGFKLKFEAKFRLQFHFSPAICRGPQTRTLPRSGRPLGKQKIAPIPL